MSTTTYQVTAWCDRPFYLELDIEAGSPEQALEIARVQAKDMFGEACDDGSDWDTFQVKDSAGNEILTHEDGGDGGREPITIEVRGGVVQEVRNLPTGYLYEIIDHDDRNEAADA